MRVRGSLKCLTKTIEKLFTDIDIDQKFVLTGVTKLVAIIKVDDSFSNNFTKQLFFPKNSTVK